MSLYAVQVLTGQEAEVCRRLADRRIATLLPQERRLILRGGAWLDDEPYGVVHRIAAAQGTRGAASFCMEWCLQKCGNIRIDTHPDNRSMQRALAKSGYTLCGSLTLTEGTEKGDPRLAYHKVL